MNSRVIHGQAGEVAVVGEYADVACRNIRGKVLRGQLGQSCRKVSTLNFRREQPKVSEVWGVGEDADIACRNAKRNC